MCDCQCYCCFCPKAQNHRRRCAAVSTTGTPIQQQQQQHQQQQQQQQDYTSGARNRFPLEVDFALKRSLFWDSKGGDVYHHSKAFTKLQEPTVAIKLPVDAGDPSTGSCNCW
eukprot:TRINITY_DN17656_c4_g1_i1.p1 TRINITY_DN17656_c4_g1~~TRINITY_DN17656_c4_g1_i1.p1  ORF type:complete len:112 (-),score=18.81 TRINITY_DN17656_c4_g1_i1:265-600(-)